MRVTVGLGQVIGPLTEAAAAGGVLFKITAAVAVAESLVSGEPFAVLLGDDLVRSGVPCIGQMIEVYERVQAPVLAVMRVPPEEIWSYGVVAVDPALPDLSATVERVRDFAGEGVGQVVVADPVLEQVAEDVERARAPRLLVQEAEELLVGLGALGGEVQVRDEERPAHLTSCRRRG